MSPKAAPKKPKPTARTKKTTSNSTVAAIGGVALVLASVLPATLSPTPPSRPSSSATSVSTTTAKRPSSRASRSTLAFQLDCELPFDHIRTEGLTIDEVCTKDGNAGEDVGKRLESNAKNNFCAEGDPIAIKFDDLNKLQAASDKIAGLKATLKTTRDPLVSVLTLTDGTQIGEGSLVRFAAFFLEAHHSNVGKGKGELVNCKLPGRDDNDIHMELMLDPTDDDPCHSLTAEMSPHFRPAAWNELVNMEISRPVRITGALFFDGSHQPCHDDKRPNPKRSSVWEIHPVYQFEICKAKALASCDADNDAHWIPLDEWKSGDVEEP